MGNERRVRSAASAGVKRKKLSAAEIQRRKKLRRWKGIKRTFKVLGILLLIMIVVIAGYGYMFVSGLNKSTLPGGIAPGKGEPVNILVLGMDIGDTENLGNSSARRTDTIMVVNYNPQTEKIHLVSLPRDTRVEIDAHLDTGEYRQYWKINSAYALGGLEEVVTQVQDLLQLQINYTVQVDYQAFRSIIDAIGGVEMHIDQDMIYDDDAQNLHIDFRAGQDLLLDGQQAENFFRWRKNNDGTGFVNGDIDRIKNQQKFLSALLDKCLTPTIIFKVPGILSAINDNVETNMPAGKMLSLGFKVLTMNKSDIIMTTIKGESEVIYGEDFIVFDKEANRELLTSLSSSNYVPSNLDVEGLKVKVLNGTSTNGLAGNIKAQLTKDGYGNVETGNYTQTDKSIIYTSKDDVFEQIKKDTGITKHGKNIPSEYSEYDAVIVLGKDYKVFGE